MFKSNKLHRGFSMIEVLVSLIVIGVGMLGLSGLQIASIKGTNNAHSRMAASTLLLELSDKMRANPLGVTGGFYDSNVNCTTDEPKCRKDRFCTPQETARFDVQEVMCGVKKAGQREGGAAKSLVNGTLVLRLAECKAANNTNDEYEAVISWSSQNVHKDQAESAQDQSVTICIVP